MAFLSDLLSQATQLRSQAFADGLKFGESPRFRDGQLYVSDMAGHKLYTIDGRTGAKKVLVESEHSMNGMGFLSDGSLVYSSMFDGKLYRLVDGTSELYVDLSPVMRGYPGDMVVDQTDRIYVDDVGSRVLHGEPRRPGQVIIVEADCSIKTTAHETHFPNGIAIDSSGKQIFLAESGAQKLSVYNIGEEGELHDKKVILDFTQFSDAKGRTGCDGLCIDAEDGLWLSLMDYKAFVRRDRHGQLTHVVHVDGHATACALGGHDGKTLYMVSSTKPEGKTLIEAMASGDTQSTITTAQVSVGRGQGLP